MTCSTKTATSSLYLIRLLIILNRVNADLLVDTDGLKKVIDINRNSAYPHKLRKASGQVYLQNQKLKQLHSTLGACNGVGNPTPP